MLTSTPPAIDTTLDSEVATRQSSSNSNVNISISIPAGIAAMSDLTITLSPRSPRVQSPAMQPMQQRLIMPPQSPVMRPRQHRPALPVSPALRPGQLTPPPPSPSFTASVHSSTSQLKPIYPVRPGRNIRLQYPLSQERTHRYYVVFRGPKLGIFYTYWYVTSILPELVNSH